MIDKNEILEEIKKNKENSRLQNLEEKIDELNEYLDKIYRCVKLKDEKVYGSTDNLPLHNLKKKALRQTIEEFNLNLFNSDEEFEIGSTKTTQNQNMSEILNVTNQFLIMANTDNAFDLLFSGGNGTGKTYLANCLANRAIESYLTVRYYSAIELFDFINEALMVDRQKNLAEYKMLTECNLLILDDLGTETITKFTDNHLFSILNSRMLDDKRTIIISNLSLVDIFNTYSKNISSRILDNYVLCKFIGEDLRFNSKK